MLSIYKTYSTYVISWPKVKVKVIAQSMSNCDPMDWRPTQAPHFLLQGSS